MKKLVVAVAAMLSAVAVNAASITWTANGVNAVVAGDTITAYTAYLIDNSQFAFSGLTSDNVLTAIATAIATSAPKSTGAISATTIFDDWSAGDSVSAYVVVMNGAKTFYTASTAVKSGTVASTGKVTLATGAVNGTWTEVAPEPTSGLMLLLGMGVLALRRRRA